MQPGWKWKTGKEKEGTGTFSECIYGMLVRAGYVPGGAGLYGGGLSGMEADSDPVKPSAKTSETETIKDSE